MRKLILPLILIASLFAGIAAAAKPNTKAPPAAEKAVMSWLDTIDAGAYEKSWHLAAPFFQTAVDSETWATQLEGVRAPLGAVRSRAIASVTVATSLPGAPDGEYVVFQMNTQFRGKAEAIETVTVVKTAKGWRGVGYYIR